MSGLCGISRTNQLCFVYFELASVLSLHDQLIIRPLSLFSTNLKLPNAVIVVRIGEEAVLSGLIKCIPTCEWEVFSFKPVFIPDTACLSSFLLTPAYQFQISVAIFCEFAACMFICFISN